MKSASSPLLKTIGARLSAVFGSDVPFVVNPSPTRPLPYGVLGSDTETDAFSTKNTDGSVITHTLRIYSNFDAKAREYASLAIDELTDRTRPLIFSDVSGTTFYSAGRVHLELNEIIEDRDERGDIYGAAIRFRFWIGQHNQP